MTDENFKLGARCMYHHLCSLYNNDIIPPDIEINMCGRGQPVDQTHEPKVPEPIDFVPTKRYAHGPGGTCDSYIRYRDGKIITQLVDHLKSSQKLITLLDKHNYW